MYIIMYFLGFFIFSALGSSYAREIDDEMTVKVKPGSAECFFESIRSGDEIDIEYQVINGEHGELDINFFLYGLLGNVIKAETRRSDGNHRLVLTEAGDYKFCFDNTFSRFSTKTVFFAYLVTNTAEEDNTEPLHSDSPYASGEEVYEMKVEDIKDALDRLRSHLSKVRIIQDALKAYEARDRNVAENNYTRINMFSCLSVVVMMGTGAVQIILLRSLFDERSKLHKIWNKNSTGLPRY